MAGKIPSDLQNIISREPKLYAAFLRRVKQEDIAKIMKDLEGKENGKRG